MSEINIRKDSKIVGVLCAQARGEAVSADLAQETAEVIKEQASNPTPHNRYQIAQLIGYAVNEIKRPMSNWLDNLADVKRVGFGDKAQFQLKQEGIRAYVQAKGSTTARSKVATKTLSLPDTLAVSARPVVNLVELKTNQVAMADLIRDAAYQMELAELAYIQKVLNDAAETWEDPYYAEGQGIVKSVLDPMVRHWVRMSGGQAPVLFGDIEMTSKLAEQTGFNGQFADAIIMEQNNAGVIGTYLGGKVVNLINPLVDATDTPTFDTNKLFMIPGFVDASMRPLKVVYEGDVVSMEETHIDDQSYEVRLDQYFNAAMVIGDRPYVGVYKDTNN